MYFVKNNSAMAIDGKGNPISISKRYPGHVRLFRDNNSVINLLSNGDDFSNPNQPVKILHDIAGDQEELSFDYPISCCVDACCTDNGYALIGSSGLYFYQNLNRIWSINVLNGASISYLNNKILEKWSRVLLYCIIEFSRY